MPRSTAWPPPPDLIDADRLVWAETVHAGGCTRLVVARGTTVRLTDLDGDACAHLQVYDADGAEERPGRLPPGRQGALTLGSQLLSDQGNALATLTHDSTGRPGSSLGTTDLELFTRAAAKHGLGSRPLRPCLSFFQTVTRERDGTPVFAGPSAPGASVSIRAEMPLVLLIANTAHPLDPDPDCECGPLEVLAWRDYCTSPGQPSRPRMG
ncbi:DUF1989 domain-containing protein [Pengzhenrongella frigida]|uniref:DUF1989 domain-containing protein n=1 Tax=Pengzhenrongella frigida TaxID=1259133 RepID=A0A4Q5MWW5_9MICO|nr:DUF1989 domain-containing protein [Cellulomonas sp. HLT2-17]RYV49423.1 DUF1989 domain-containing protein [Cellulomonas sp. HLT2-17]